MATLGMPADGTVPQWFEDQAKAEKIYAWIALVACLAWFVFYLVKMYCDGCADLAVFATVEGIQNGDITIYGAMQAELDSCDATGLGEKLIKNENPKELDRLKAILMPFFKQYDADKTGDIDRLEFISLLRDLRVNASIHEQVKMFEAADSNHSGTIDFEEFVVCALKTVLHDSTFTPKGNAGPMLPPQSDSQDDKEDEEEDEMPEDLAALPPSEQQKRIKQRAMYGMGMGTLLVLFFSDPMCDMLGVIGDKIEVPKFYVAFLLAPLASNASELIAAMKLASKKTAKSMVDSLSSLEGAAVMNNTFCMGIFLFLIIYQNLAFTYKAETAAIICVELFIGALALKGTVMKLIDAVIVFSMYPLCLIIVVVLEKGVGLD